MSSEAETSPTIPRRATSCLAGDFSASLEMTKKILLGAHMSIGGGVHRAIERSCSVNANAIQIFVKNNMQWFARALTKAEIRAFLEHA